MASPAAFRSSSSSSSLSDLSDSNFDGLSLNFLHDATNKGKARADTEVEPQLSPEDAYLCLTKEDVDTLKDDWLTDNYTSSHIVLLRPSMSFLLLQTPDPSTLKGVLPDLSKTTHIFLPINDCANVNQPEGGTHWSLLLVSVIDGVSFHYDSMDPQNFRDAQNTSFKISKLLGLQRPLRFINLESPQQNNSMDCGVFVCILMKFLLLNKLLLHNSNEKVSMSMAGKQIDAAGGRKEMLKVIESFRKEGERRRSRSASPFRPGSKKLSKSPPRIDY
ncbi:MAG: hypothetical protein M1834_006357 [Cirrosporium novae-zelandiae]|nr:MAG: hypothetical protein M1834_006357 [Cirrosporium novae-zelandiae]